MRNNPEPPAHSEMSVLVGRNAVLEALNHGKPIDKIFFKTGEIEGTLRVILAKAKDAGIVTVQAGKNKLDELAQAGRGVSHQGVVATCPAREYAQVEDLLQLAQEKGEQPFVIVLDGITDPYNLGAIIRTADACGAHGVIIPKRRAAGLTPIVSKTSAGAAEHVLVARAVNLARELDNLRKRGLWTACADASGQDIYSADLSGPMALVIGSEGGGVGRLVMDKCDLRVRIPMYGAVSSLNASVAAGVLMYEVRRRRLPMAVPPSRPAYPPSRPEGDPFVQKA
ncbi:MAG: 23S rRNA (guanosine(2251)-2'-O)-methyltransferase RlmB [Clostridiales bacterium]|jgi:23S rRNA (guanosine2251-2'-O)-methyltransferase|nr:23S rRNA (guanosine(2251)-2'-O)-methyltransferase RlmB [Clostridiales bacterium]